MKNAVIFLGSSVKTGKPVKLVTLHRPDCLVNDLDKILECALRLGTPPEEFSRISGKAGKYSIAFWDGEIIPECGDPDRSCLWKNLAALFRKVARDCEARSKEGEQSWVRKQ